MLKNYFSFYLLLICLPLLLLAPALFSNIIYSLVIIAVLSMIMTIVPYLLIIKKYNFFDKRVIDYILSGIALISYITGVILIICVESYPYILLVTLSMILYFIIIFTCNKFKR